FTAGASHWFHSYIWGRFAQPIGLIYARNDQIVQVVQSALMQAVLRFVVQVLPSIPASFTARSLWCKGWTLSYRAELRAERPHKLVQLYEAAPRYYEQLTRSAIGRLPFHIDVQKDKKTYCYSASFSDNVRRKSRLNWTVRSWQGKLLSTLRLLKGVLTFRGGVDYILWKIERHSGEKVEVPPQLKRYPLIATFVIFWKLYRRGAYR
ncbi:MAG: hypothetical protein KJP06_00660, partial [Deltaproteobacteria bacterium]|nr:hypothetical protein [Deltaproteobacteria bacterium]